MDDFIRAQIKSVLRTPNAPRPRAAQCLEIKKLAPRSVAAHAGVAPGDLLAFVDGAPASKLQPELYTHRAARRAYTFHSRARQETIEMVATGIEIGVVLAPSVEAVKARFDPQRADYDALETLWEARDWPALESLSADALKTSSQYRETPVLLFLGGAFYERQNLDEGIALVDEFAREHADNWTTNYIAIALYYQGREHLRRGERERGVEALRRAWEYKNIPRVADVLQNETGERPPEDPPRWVGRAFPAEYALPLLEAGPGRRSLPEALGPLSAGQLFAVCLLASYRGNGPYNDFMARYHNYATYFGRYLPGLHVLTSEPKRRADLAWYWENEDRVREAGLPLAVLLDEDESVTRAVMPSGSPFILLLDHDRQVVYEGELDSVDFWNALAAVNPG